VGEVGDGAVAVLKIKGREELAGALGADLGKGFAHGECGAGVLGHGEGENFGIGAMDGEDLSLVAGFGRNKRFTGHEYGLADRIRHKAACVAAKVVDAVFLGWQNADRAFLAALEAIGSNEGANRWANGKPQRNLNEN